MSDPRFRRENVSVMLDAPQVFATVNAKGEETLTIRLAYRAGRNVDLTTVQVYPETAEALIRHLRRVLDE